MKFTLIAEHETGEKNTYEFDKEYLPDVLENIDLFLRGCGFWHTGVLDIVEEETYYKSSYDFSAMDAMNATVGASEDTVQHAPNYWDTGRNR
jgi:hypothetical protein